MPTALRSLGWLAVGVWRACAPTSGEGTTAGGEAAAPPSMEGPAPICSSAAELLPATAAGGAGLAAGASFGSHGACALEEGPAEAALACCTGTANTRRHTESQRWARPAANAGCAALTGLACCWRVARVCSDLKTLADGQIRQHGGRSGGADGGSRPLRMRRCCLCACRCGQHTPCCAQLCCDRIGADICL